MEERRVNNPNMLINKDEVVLGIQGGWVFVDPAKVDLIATNVKTGWDRNGTVAVTGAGTGKVMLSINTTQNGSKITIPPTVELPKTPGWVWTGSDPAPTTGSWYFDYGDKSFNKTYGSEQHGYNYTTETKTMCYGYWIGPGTPTFYPVELMYKTRLISINKLYTMIKNNKTFNWTNTNNYEYSYTKREWLVKDQTAEKRTQDHIHRIVQYKILEILKLLNNPTISGINWNAFFLYNDSDEENKRFSDAVGTIIKEHDDTIQKTLAELNAVEQKLQNLHYEQIKQLQTDYTKKFEKIKSSSGGAIRHYYVKKTRRRSIKHRRKTVSRKHH